jgi:hypothetical protein
MKMVVSEVAVGPWNVFRLPGELRILPKLGLCSNGLQTLGCAQVGARIVVLTP